MVEVDAARSRSKLDSFVEVLDAPGRRIERVLLQAVRDSYFTFRGKDDSTVDDFRLFNWEEMRLNEYLYANGEVVKFWLYPRGPDSGFLVYPGQGKRWGYFDTTPLAHALGEPCYVVQPHPPGTELIPNGLPVFPLYFENDDDAHRELGKDSRSTSPRRPTASTSSSSGTSGAWKHLSEHPHAEVCISIISLQPNDPYLRLINPSHHFA